MKALDKKKAMILFSMLGMIVYVTAVNHSLSNQEELQVSSGYEEYELAQLEHDVEVLVDSIHVVSVPGTSAEAGLDSLATWGEASVVTSDNVEELTNKDTYFQEMRSSITMDRNEILSMLTDVAEDLPDGAEKTRATQTKLKLIEYMNTENEIESLIQNKGFAEVLVVITDTSVNVSVKKQDLSQADIAKIMDITMHETGRKAEEIVIQSKF
jgi:hypothetical protein